MSFLNSSNKVLAEAEQKIESNLLPDVHAIYMKIVVSGMKVALKNGEAGILAGLKKKANPLNDCAIGAVNLVVMLKQQAKGMMPEKAMVPASMTLMIHALDFADRAGIIKVGAEELSKATRIWANYLLKVSNVTPAMMAQAGTKVAGVMSDPTSMEALARRAGTVKDPRASTPTDMAATGKQ